MHDREIAEISARIVEEMLKPHNIDLLAAAIAKELRRMATQYSLDVEKLGRTLEDHHY